MLAVVWVWSGYCHATAIQASGRTASWGFRPAATRASPHPSLGRGVFLVASRNMDGPIFSETVILITQYDRSGTVGIIINRPVQIPAAHALPSLSSLKLDPGQVHLGGPVALNALQVLVRSPTPPDGAEHVFEDVYLVNSPSVLASMLATGGEPVALHVYAGYAGWATGQLERELIQGDWFLWPADADSVFSLPSDTLWQDMIDRAAAQWVLQTPPAPLRPWLVAVHRSSTALPGLSRSGQLGQFRQESAIVP